MFIAKVESIHESPCFCTNILEKAEYLPLRCFRGIIYAVMFELIVGLSIVLGLVVWHLLLF